MEMTEERRAVLVQKRQLGYAALGVMEGQLASRDSFVAGRYSVADIALYAYSYVADEGGFGLGRFPRSAPGWSASRRSRAHTDNPILRGETVSLEMSTECEHCGGTPAHDGPACICSCECAFCERCATKKGLVCPNCGGQLLERPRRRPEGPPQA